MPSDGWLVRGVFTEVQKGNRLRRSTIRSGLGKKELQVVTCIDKLSGGPLEPLYEIQTDAMSGNAPDAGDLIVVNPAAPVVRRALTGNDLTKSVKRTAKEIAAQMDQQVVSNTKTRQVTGTN